MKNLLVARRTSKLRAAGIASAVAVLTDWDTFLLAALAKLSGCYSLFCGLSSSNLVVATSSTYPYMWVFFDSFDIESVTDVSSVS